MKFGEEHAIVLNAYSHFEVFTCLKQRRRTEKTVLTTLRVECERRQKSLEEAELNLKIITLLTNVLHPLIIFELRFVNCITF